ncbi:MAG: hypothetical protein ACRD3I_05210, partial [Terriglobales bacterium]
ATENPWILQEAEKRGLVPTFVFVDADPEKTWENPERGVVKRAETIGRMVDAHPYADSYALGAKNFYDFYQTYKDSGRAQFILVENRNRPTGKSDKDGNPIRGPKLLNEFPMEAVVDRKQLYDRAAKVMDERAATLPPFIFRGGTIGRSIWGNA